MSNVVKVPPDCKEEVEADSSINKIITEEKAYLIVSGDLKNLNSIIAGKDSLIKLVGDIKNIENVKLKEHSCIRLDGSGEEIDKLELEYFSHMDARENLEIESLKIGEKARVRSYKDIEADKKLIYN